MLKGRSLFVSLLAILAVGILSVSVLRVSPVFGDKSDIPVGAPEVCEKYYGDQICDDTANDCGSNFHIGVSLAACDELQTGGFPPAAPSSGGTPGEEGNGIPQVCGGYGSSTDKYCDDSPSNCASGYVSGFSVAECKECSTGKWKDCKGTSTKPEIKLSTEVTLTPLDKNILYAIDVRNPTSSPVTVDVQLEGVSDADGKPIAADFSKMEPVSQGWKLLPEGRVFLILNITFKSSGLHTINTIVYQDGIHDDAHKLASKEDSVILLEKKAGVYSCIINKVGGLSFFDCKIQ